MTLKLGIIGCGVIGRMHLRSATGDPAIDVVTVADVDHEAVAAAARDFEVPQTYASGEALLENEAIDAVVLALVTGVRGDLATRALRAGKHVLLEKPPAKDAAELQAILDLATERGRVVASCSSRLTFNPVAERARAVVASGALGAVRTIHVRCVKGVEPANPDSTPPPWRVHRELNGGGFLVNWGVYDLDFMLYVLGDAFEPASVLAQAWPVAPDLASGRVDPDSDAECHAVALMRGRAGETWLLERGEFTTLPTSLRWQIAGDRAGLSIRMVKEGVGPVLTLHRADPRGGVTDEVLLGDYGEDVQHRMPVRDFAAAIRDGRPPRTDGRRAMKVQRMIDAIYASADAARPITL